MGQSKQTPVYVLKRERITDEGQIVSQNLGVTFSVHEAEGHKSASFENDFDTLQFSGIVQDQTAATELILAMRQCFEDVEESLK